MRLLILLLFLSIQSASNSQTVLSRQNFDFQKSDKLNQIINAVNEQSKEFYVIAADKRDLIVYKYNRAFFITDSIRIVFQDREDYIVPLGCSFDDDGNPTVYWASEDYMKVQAFSLNFQTKSAVTKHSTYTFKDEQLLFTFQAGNQLNFLASGEKSANENQLKIYTFINGTSTASIVDLSVLKFSDQRNNTISVKELFENNPPELIDSKAYVPLVTGASKSKLFIDQNNLILTLDHKLAETQLINISLENFLFTEKLVPQQQLPSGAGESTSFYHSGKLFQLKFNQEELALSVFDFATQQTIKHFAAGKSDDIKFRNSPLLMQIESNRPREFKNTKKFLNKAANATAALTVYRTPDHFLLTSGAVRPIASTGDVMIGLLAMGAGLSDGGVDLATINRSNVQSYFFETLLDTKSEHVEVTQTPIAADLLSQFMSDAKDVSHETITPFDNYLVMGYFDKKAKSYILRKFEDVRRY